jgi:hypothetical protein
MVKLTAEPSEEDQGVLQHNRGHSGDRAALGSAPWAAIEVLSRLFFKWHVRDRPS